MAAGVQTLIILNASLVSEAQSMWHGTPLNKNWYLFNSISAIDQIILLMMSRYCIPLHTSRVYVKVYLFWSTLVTGVTRYLFYYLLFGTHINYSQLRDQVEHYSIIEKGLPYIWCEGPLPLWPLILIGEVYSTQSRNFPILLYLITYLLLRCSSAPNTAAELLLMGCAIIQLGLCIWIHSHSRYLYFKVKGNSSTVA